MDSPIFKQQKVTRLDFLGFMFILVVSVFIRAIFFTGFFGSDEVTYVRSAVAIANGEWLTTSTYIGTLRYGMNIPMGFFIAVLGQNEWSAAMWAFGSSVGEVALVFYMAHTLWGFRAALLSSAVIALLPLHVTLAGRLLADAPLAFFITLSFVLFWRAEMRRSSAQYFAAGLAAGSVFWVKEVALVYLVVFVIYGVIYRKWNWRWLWMTLGVGLMLGANCLLLWIIAGDPLHIVNVVRTAAHNYVHVFETENSPWYYFHYLFADARHTWLAPYIAVGGITLWARELFRSRFDPQGTTYVVLWGAGLILVFSFMPISFNPLQLIAKQTNYMAIFVAPLCMMAGYCLTRLAARGLILTLAILVGGSFILAGLEQQVIPYRKRSS